MLTALARASRPGALGEPAEIGRLAIVVWEKTQGVPVRVLSEGPPAELHEWTWQPAFSADPFLAFQRLTGLVIDGPASRSRVSSNDLQADPTPFELAAGAFASPAIPTRLGMSARQGGDAPELAARTPRDQPPEAAFCGYQILDAQGASPRAMLVIPAAGEVDGAHAVVEELMVRLGLLVEVTETTRSGVRFTFEDGRYYAVWDSLERAAEDPTMPLRQPRFRVLADGSGDPLLEKLVRVLLASSRLPSWTLRGDDAFYRSATVWAPPSTLSHLYWPDPTTLEGTESFNDWMDWLDRLVPARRLAEVVVRATVVAPGGAAEDPLALTWEPRKGRLEATCELSVVSAEQVERLLGMVLMVQAEEPTRG